MFNQDLLYQHLFYCKIPEYKHQCSEFPRTIEDRFYKKEPPKEFWVAGFKFTEGNVYAYNILIYSDTNWDNAEYLNVTDVFVKLKKHYNVFHIVFLMQLIMRKYYRENVFIENHYLHFKYYTETLTKKKKYATEKHRHRQGKYINRDGNTIQGVWNRILISSAKNEVFIKALSKFKNKRFDSDSYIWNIRDAISNTSHKL